MNATRKPPVAGIGFGQQGYWCNRHFTTLELAQSAYDRMAAELRNEIVPSGTGGRLCWRHGSIETPIEPPPGSTLIRGARFRGLLKSGKPGKTVHTIYLYRIDDRTAAKFMESPFYCPEA